MWMPKGRDTHVQWIGHVPNDRKTFHAFEASAQKNDYLDISEILDISLLDSIRIANLIALLLHRLKALYSLKSSSRNNPTL